MAVLRTNAIRSEPKSSPAQRSKKGARVRDTMGAGRTRSVGGVIRPGAVAGELRSGAVFSFRAGAALTSHLQDGKQVSDERAQRRAGAPVWRADFLRFQLRWRAQPRG